MYNFKKIKKVVINESHLFYFENKVFRNFSLNAKLLEKKIRYEFLHFTWTTQDSSNK